jgi:purine-binding chemotaxis protein CheW
MTQLSGIVTFAYGKGRYGVPLSCVAEVLGHCRINPLPGLPAHISGMINLRGSIIAAIDIGPLMGIKGNNSPGAIVIKHKFSNAKNASELEERHVAILVDEVGDILTDKEWVRHAVPANVPTYIINLLDGVINKGNETINLLNLDELLRQCTAEESLV